MAKEIIEEIKKAETAAAEGISNAKAEADKLINDARDAAKTYYESEIKKARDAASSKVSDAEAAAEKVISEAEGKAAEAKEALKAAAAAKQPEAVKAVIDSLL
ncbi:MAG: hypothetical protein Q4E57_03785 [Eubacteriales bacterium]|nr:hypothetical protein [Eubacteriales bacterium]